MEKLNRCFLCDSDDSSFAPFSGKNGYKIVRCGKCGLIFVNPRDDQNVISSQYEEDMTSPISYYQSTVNADTVNFNRKLSLIENKLPKGKLLDIGCSVGTFLEIAAKKGWSVTGLEANKKACEICRNKGLKMYEGFFTDELIQSLKRENFNLVCMFDSIEHFPNPLETLKLVSGLMPKNSFLALSTPNIESLLGKMFQIKPKEHLFYFSCDSLKKALEQSGFKVEFVKEMKRRRDVGAMHLGASLDKKWLWISEFLSFTKLHTPINIFLETFFREEVFALAKKI